MSLIWDFIQFVIVLYVGAYALTFLLHAVVLLISPSLHERMENAERRGSPYQTRW